MRNFLMNWYVVSLRPEISKCFNVFPVYIGREQLGHNCVLLRDPCVSRHQFTLEKNVLGVRIVNHGGRPFELDGQLVDAAAKLSPNIPHIVKIGFLSLGIGTDFNAVCQRLSEEGPQCDVFFASKDGNLVGPMTADELVLKCEKEELRRDSLVWYAWDDQNRFRADEIVDFEPVQDTATVSGGRVSNPDFGTETKKRWVDSDEMEVELGENFKCPYCRTVSDLEDVMSVAVSPALKGDPVLGDLEPRRFLPTQFTATGLAIDSDGGVCTEIACPRCHMSLPQTLLETPQVVMSVVGAAGAGKSVFLASCIWRSRQLLRKMFGVNFTDLDPKFNNWIRGYEERLFFQQDDQQLQQIEKTDLQASNISRNVTLDGDSVLLPTPSFFKLTKTNDGSPAESFVVYDCAGEHFRPGADVHSSLVTLHTLNADVLLFLFDPSADPRFRGQLDMGEGTARNYAQMQDQLLSELAAKAMKHQGNRGKSKLSIPLVFGISKADMLRAHLPLEVELYQRQANGLYALDLDAFRKVSKVTEAYVDSLAPEVTAAAHDIADEVWFVPISALGHNPMREGVRPCDIHPIWTELPVVFTLAKQGYIPTVGQGF